MNEAERHSVTVIIDTLGANPAFRKLDDGLFVVKQGSAFVMIHVAPLDGERAVVRCVAQLVEEAQLERDVALELLRLNATLRFGAFAFVPERNVVIFLHSILGGATLDRAELVATVRDVALIADHYDEAIAAQCGGRLMHDGIEEEALCRAIAQSPDAFGHEE